MLENLTVVCMLVITLILSGGAVAVVRREKLPVPGAARWASGNLVGSVGIILSAAHKFLPDLLGIVLANTLVVVALVMLLGGYQQFVGRSVRVGAGFVISALAAAGLFYFTMVEPSPTHRMVLMSSVQSVLAGLSAWVLFRHDFEWRLVRHICGLINLVMSLFHVARVVVLVQIIFSDMGTGAGLSVNVLGFGHLLLSTFAQLILISGWLNAELKRQANIDPLTGAQNRRAFALVAENAMARSVRSGRPVMALLFDLDHFKRANDTRGHAFGDDLLRRFSVLAQSVLRDQDSFCRYGGEEFVALLPDTDAEHAVTVAERLRRTFAEDAMAQAVSATVSIGIARYQPGDTLDSLMRRADRALYRAKEKGRNRCILSEGDAEIVFIPPGGVMSAV